MQRLRLNALCSRAWRDIWEDAGIAGFQPGLGNAEPASMNATWHAGLKNLTQKAVAQLSKAQILSYPGLSRVSRHHFPDVRAALGCRDKPGNDKMSSPIRF